MKKRGPKHKAKGADYGWPVTKKMRQKMYSGYDRFSGPGVPLTTIYQRTLTKIFKCKTRRQGARTEFYHPKTKPFPSWDQFRNNIVRHYGADRIRTDKLGEQRTRTQKRPSKGAFTALVANINEQIYADGYFLPEVPKSERDDKPMKPMVVVRIRDVASGAHYRNWIRRWRRNRAGLSIGSVLQSDCKAGLWSSYGSGNSRGRLADGRSSAMDGD